MERTRSLATRFGERATQRCGGGVIKSMEEKDALKELYWNDKLTLRQIGNRYNYCAQTILNWMKKYNIPRRTGRELGKFVYERSERVRKALATSAENSRKKPNLSPSQDFCYVLGVVLGDGYISQCGYEFRIGANVKDKEFAEAFQRSLNRIRLNAGIWRAKNGMYIVHANSRLLVEWFREVGLDEIGKIVSQNQEFIASFIRGFYDSEGNLGKRSLSLSNKDLRKIRLVQELVETIGFRTSLKKECKRLSGEIWILNVLGGIREQNRFMRLINPTIPRRAQIRHLKKKVRAWTPKELDFLMKNYLSNKNREIAKAMDRTEASIMGMAQRLSINKKGFLARLAHERERNKLGQFIN